jgi:hypothetical protein
MRPTHLRGPSPAAGTRLQLSGVLIILLLATLVPTAAVAHAYRDVVWTRPELTRRTLDKIAILPVVNVVDDHRAEQFVEDRLWIAFCSRTRPIWVMPEDSRKLLLRNARHPYSQLDSLSRQVWREGKIDSEAAGGIARQLGVGSVMCVRLNQWEHLESWDPHHMRASIFVQAAVVDSGGKVLWSVRGGNSAGTSLSQQAALAQTATRSILDWCAIGSTANRYGAPDFDGALRGLLDRWAKLFPSPRG